MSRYRGVRPVVFISELSEVTGVSTRMLRYYEERGLLTPTRLDNGYRVYRNTDAARVLRLKELFGRGITSTVVLSNPRYLAMLDDDQEFETEH